MSETDTKACPVNEAQALFQDLDKPSLHALSYALRHPDTWPQGFVWDYRSCDQCAMGLAHQLWKDKVTNANKDTGPTIMARAFAMPYDAARSIFLAEETGRQGRHIANWAPKKRDFTKGHLWENRLGEAGCTECHPRDGRRPDRQVSHHCRVAL